MHPLFSNPGDQYPTRGSSGVESTVNQHGLISQHMSAPPDFHPELPEPQVLEGQRWMGQTLPP